MFRSKMELRFRSIALSLLTILVLQPFLPLVGLVSAESIPENYPLSFPVTDEEVFDNFYSEVNGKVESFYNIKTEEVYQYFLNSNVSIRFTKLPEGNNSFSIEEKKIETDQLKVVGYEFLSPMVDGTFEYEMELPNPFGNDVSVKYSEDGANFSEVENKVLENSTLRFAANHFTIFVVVPEDIIPNSLISYLQQGWRLSSTGNASTTLVSSSSNLVPNDFGPHVLKLSRTGGSGINRSYVGYFEANRKLKDLEKISWNRYTKQGTDTYLNIYLRNPNNLLQTASVVYVPTTSNGFWQNSVFDSTSSNIQIRVGGSTSNISWVNLMNQYGEWYIENHTECLVSGILACLNLNNNITIGGIVIVSGSSSPTAPQEHYIDGIELKFVGSDSKNFDFAQEIPTQPLVEILSPASNTVVHGVVHVKVKITHSGYGLNPDQLWAKFVDGTTPNQFGATKLTPVAGEEDIYEAYIDATGINGIYNFGVDVIDNLGMGRSAKTVNIFVDSTGPAVTIENPTVNNYVRGTITGRAIAEDLGGMGSYYLRFWKDAFENGSYVGNCQEAPGANLLGTYLDKTCTYDTTQNPDGVYVFSAQFLDTYNQWGQALRQFYVDNTKPTIHIKGVGNVFTPGSIGVENVFKEVSFKLYDKYKIDKVVINGVEKNLSNSEWSDVNNVKPGIFGAIEGQNTIEVFDLAGNSTIYEFILDTTAPSIPVNGMPHNTIINTNYFYFTWNDSTDENGPIRYEFQSSLSPSNSNGVLNTGVWKNTESSHPEQNPLTLAQILSFGAPDGTWYWQVRAIDKVGNTSEWSEIWNVTIDTTPPATPTILGFKNPDLSCSAVTDVNSVTVDWNDVGGAVKYHYEIDYPLENGGRGLWTTQFTKSQYSGTLNYGLHIIRVRAEDAAGNLSEWSEPCNITREDLATITIYKNLIDEQGEEISSEQLFTVSLLKKTDESSEQLEVGTISDSEMDSKTSTFQVFSGLYAVQENDEEGYFNLGCVRTNYNVESLVTVLAGHIAANMGPINDGYFYVEPGEDVEVICTNQINSEPKVEILATPAANTQKGIDITLTANVLGGNGILTYAWTCDTGETSNNLTLVLTNVGKHNCEVTVTDEDGDEGNAFGLYTIIATETAPNNPSIPQNPSNPQGGVGGPGNFTDGSVAGVNTTTNTEEEDEGQVLGILTCSDKSSVEGSIFIDKNDNGIKDSDEDGAVDIQVTILTTIINEKGEKEIIELTNVRTNRNGEWRVDLCPGEYKVIVNRNDLPENTELESNERVLGVSEDDIENFNFAIQSTFEETQQDNQFNWWVIVLLILVALGLIGGGLLYNKSKNNSNIA